MVFLDLFTPPPHVCTLLHISGEALLVSGGLVLYFGDMLAHTLSKVCFILPASDKDDSLFA